MSRTHTRFSRAAAVSTSVTGLVLLEQMAFGHLTGYLVVLLGFLGLLALLTSARLWCENCFESRLSAVVLALASGVGASLSVTVGLPGEAAAALSAGSVLLTALAVTTLVLVFLDSRARATAVTHDAPYAS